MNTSKVKCKRASRELEARTGCKMYLAYYRQNDNVWHPVVNMNGQPLVYRSELAALADGHHIREAWARRSKAETGR